LRAFLSPSTENRGINMLLACHRCYQLPTFNDNCLECQDCNWHQWAEDENDAVSDALEAKQLIPIEASDRGVNYLYQSDTWKGYNDENGKPLLNLKPKKQDIQFLFKLKNNYYCFDGVTLTTIYLERVIVIGQEFVGKGDFDIVYSGDYESIPIWQFFQILLAKLFLFWKKEQRLNKC
jgi:hypothetical protein